MFSSENGDSAYYHRVRMRQACLEDWDATMELLFPGTAGAMKRMRAVIGEAITGVRSRTRLEQFDCRTTPAVCWDSDGARAQTEGREAENEEELLKQLEYAKEDFRSSSYKQTTLVEAM